MIDLFHGVGGAATDGRVSRGPSVRAPPSALRAAPAWAAAELTCLFGALALVTGPLWARKAWGVWWQWDVRLTASLMGWMVSCAYLLLRQYGGPGADKLAAGLSLFGMANVPFIYVSVNYWRTVHPATSVVPTLPFSMAGGDSTLSLAVNWTDTKLEEITALADATRKMQLEDQLPEYRAVLTGTHAIGPWRFLARASYYDSFISALEIGADASGTFDGKYGAKTMFDVEAAYTIAGHYTITVGAQNVFDTYPDKFPNPEINSGAIYPGISPYGFNGGFWYARLNVDF